MKMNEATAALVVVGTLAVSFAFAPLALATASSSSYPFEIVGRAEYVAPPGASNPFGTVGTATFYGPSAVSAAPFAWVPASTYSTSPGHGL